MINFHEANILGAIFDMDGTMFDTERLRFQTLKQAALELINVEFSDEYLLSCLGLSAKSAEQLAKERYGQDVPYADIRKRADQLEVEHVRKYGVPVKFGLVQVLERLRKSNLKMAVATSSRREIAEEYLINAKVYKFFDVIVCGDDVQQGKPHPEIFLKAAEQLNLAPSTCFMVEDSANGIRSAYEAGGKTVLIKDIKSPDTTMRQQAQFYYDSMQDYLDALDESTPRLDMPALQDLFPQTLNQHVVGIHGFGAIGGGYIAQILSHWDGYTRPQLIYATTGNPLYRNAVNSFGGYAIRYNQYSFDEHIRHVHVLDADNIEQIQQMYIESSLIAICLPEQALEEESNAIAQGLYARHLQQGHEAQPLTLLIILNKIGAKQLLLNYVQQALAEIAGDDLAAAIMQEHYFCDTVVNRMVSKITDQQLFRQLRIRYNQLQNYQDENQQATGLDVEDGTRLNRSQEMLANTYIETLYEQFKPAHALQQMELILFHAEADMPIYVENNSPMLAKMRQMILVDNIEQIQVIKNRLWNGSHAILAWAARILGYQNIAVALADDRIERFIHQLLAEIQQGLVHSYPERKQNLQQLTQSFLESCKHAFKDPCERVGRDPFRKLEVNERVFGSVQYHVQHGLSQQYLSIGLLLGYLYAMAFEQIPYARAIQYLKQQLIQSDLSSQSQQQLYDFIRRHLQPIDANYMHPADIQEMVRQLIVGGEMTHFDSQVSINEHHNLQ